MSALLAVSLLLGAAAARVESIHLSDTGAHTSVRVAWSGTPALVSVHREGNVARVTPVDAEMGLVFSGGSRFAWTSGTAPAPVSEAPFQGLDVESRKGEVFLNFRVAPATPIDVRRGTDYDRVLPRWAPPRVRSLPDGWRPRSSPWPRWPGSRAGHDVPAGARHRAAAGRGSRSGSRSGTAFGSGPVAPVAEPQSAPPPPAPKEAAPAAPSGLAERGHDERPRVGDGGQTDAADPGRRRPPARSDLHQRLFPVPAETAGDDTLRTALRRPISTPSSSPTRRRRLPLPLRPRSRFARLRGDGSRPAHGAVQPPSRCARGLRGRNGQLPLNPEPVSDQYLEIQPKIAADAAVGAGSSR